MTIFAKILGILAVFGVVALAAALPANTAQSATDSPTVGEFIDDATITTEVKSKILMEKGLSSLDISVETVGGVVTLTGDVKSQELADKAGEVAALVKGVKQVDNKLLVRP